MSNYDSLQACPILRIVRDGDSSTEYLIGSKVALRKKTDEMLRHIATGIEVLKNISSIEFGEEDSMAFISNEFGNLIDAMAHQVKLNLAAWLGSPV
jgi:hypothetical protein